jgi:hypothetical protein
MSIVLIHLRDWLHLREIRCADNWKRHDLTRKWTETLGLRQGPIFLRAVENLTGTPTEVYLTWSVSIGATRKGPLRNERISWGVSNPGTLQTIGHSWKFYSERRGESSGYGYFWLGLLFFEYKMALVRDHWLLVLFCHLLFRRHLIDLYFKREVCEARRKFELVSDCQNGQEACLIECLHI